MMKTNPLRQVLYILAIAMALPFLSVPSAANIKFTITGVVEAKTCVFNDTALTIDLPEVDTRSLASASVVKGKTYFSMKLVCSNGVSEVNIIPSGTAVSNGDSTLFLNIGSAKNVGLRLLDNTDNVLMPNGQSKATFDFNETGGTYNFSAGYSGTGAGRVSGGTFQAVVNFTLDYS